MARSSFGEEVSDRVALWIGLGAIAGLVIIVCAIIWGVVEITQAVNCS